jgi:phosphoribosylamine--glycine ligase
MVRGDAISFTPEIEAALRQPTSDLSVYVDGVRHTPELGFVTTGGRAVTIVAAGETVAEARESAYAAAGGVSFRGMHVRRDIARF